jgi:hypothetical protein
MQGDQGSHATIGKSAVELMMLTRAIVKAVWLTVLMAPASGVECISLGSRKIRVLGRATSPGWVRT